MTDLNRFDYFLIVLIVLCSCVFLFGMVALEAMQAYPDLWPVVR